LWWRGPKEAEEDRQEVKTDTGDPKRRRQRRQRRCDGGLRTGGAEEGIRRRRQRRLRRRRPGRKVHIEYIRRDEDMREEDEARSMLISNRRDD